MDNPNDIFKQWADDQPKHYYIHFLLSIPITLIFSPLCSIVGGGMVELNQWALHRQLWDWNQIPIGYCILDSLLDWVSWSIFPVLWLNRWFFLSIFRDLL